MYNLVVFASGNGTTLQAIIDAIKNKQLNAKINLVVSNNENAYALERAKNAGIENYIIKNKNTNDVDIELTEKLKKYNVDLIVLAGYLKLIGQNLIKNYTIINTHPSLLPKFGGKGMYRNECTQSSNRSQRRIQRSNLALRKQQIRRGKYNKTNKSKSRKRRYTRNVIHKSTKSWEDTINRGIKGICK